MKSMLFSILLLLSSLLGFTACTQEGVQSQPAEPGVLYQTTFGQGQDGWEVGYTDYEVQTADLEFESAWTGLPRPLDTRRKAIMVSSTNHSDDVFMFLKRKLTGLQPNTDYALVFDVELASAYADNSIGTGGSPGSSVFLKAGASATEPQKQLKSGFYELSIDKGIQAQSGRDAVVLGTIGAGEDVTDYKLITRSNAAKPFAARTNSAGELWLIVGTDSGYEGQTTLYYTRIKVTAK